MEYDWNIARENMKKIRQQHNMTVLALSKELKWGHATIGSYETGKRTPTILYVIEFCKYFKVTIENLFKKGM